MVTTSWAKPHERPRHTSPLTASSATSAHETPVFLRGPRLAPASRRTTVTPREGGSMSNKNDYSPEEWKAITGAPVAAGMFVALSDKSGLVGIAKEALAVGKAIAESARGDAPEVV